MKFLLVALTATGASIVVNNGFRLNFLSIEHSMQHECTNAETIHVFPPVYSWGSIEEAGKEIIYSQHFLLL